MLITRLAIGALVAGGALVGSATAGVAALADDLPAKKPAIERPCDHPRGLDRTGV